MREIIAPKKRERTTKQWNELLSLNREELFYINYNSITMLFKFNGLSGDWIYGINPITNEEFKIDDNFDVMKINNSRYI